MANMAATSTGPDSDRRLWTIEHNHGTGSPQDGIVESE
jgi:hypothetical protein